MSATARCAARLVRRRARRTALSGRGPIEARWLRSMRCQRAAIATNVQALIVPIRHDQAASFRGEPRRRERCNSPRWTCARSTKSHRRSRSRARILLRIFRSGSGSDGVSHATTKVLAAASARAQSCARRSVRRNRTPRRWYSTRRAHHDHDVPRDAGRARALVRSCGCARPSDGASEDDAEHQRSRCGAEASALQPYARSDARGGIGNV